MNIRPWICCALLLSLPRLAHAAEDNPHRAFWRKFCQEKQLPKPSLSLNAPGEPLFVDYTKYGAFERAGERSYRFEVKDMKGLARAVGEGVYPNRALLTEQDFPDVIQKASPHKYWSYLDSPDFKTALYVWSQATEDSGVRAFFMAKILERAGLISQAVKAYYATAVHFPRAVSWAADHSFVWYIAPAAMAAVDRLCRDYSELNCMLEGASFNVKNGDDLNLNNDVITVDPGRIVRRTLEEKIKAIRHLARLTVVETRGKGKVRLVRYSNGHWQMLVNGKPFFVRGASYLPTRIGTGPLKDLNALDRWMFTDTNANGLIDAPYEAWVDRNGNGRQDRNEKPVGDFQLMKDIGINAIRLFAPNHPSDQYDPSLLNKPLLRDMVNRFGIYAVMVDLLGAYTIGSGAAWDKGTDYTDPEQRRKMKEVVRAKVLDLKDEPFVLMWLLGNENNLPAAYMGVNATRTNAGLHPRAYAEFLNEVAEMIHGLDPNHPVAVGNVELGLVDAYAQYAPQLDVIGINSYRGADGFGSLFMEAAGKFDRPVLITEYGTDAYAEGKGLDEAAQAHYHAGTWRDLIYNGAGGPGRGNAIGGLIFEYLDEWWKAPDNPEDVHEAAHQQKGLSPDGYTHEEWFGIVGQGSGNHSPFERQLRKAYFFYKRTAQNSP